MIRGVRTARDGWLTLRCNRTFHKTLFLAYMMYGATVCSSFQLNAVACPCPLSLCMKCGWTPRGTCTYFSFFHCVASPFHSFVTTRGVPSFRDTTHRTCTSARASIAQSAELPWRIAPPRPEHCPSRFALLSSSSLHSRTTCVTPSTP